MEMLHLQSLSLVDAGLKVARVEGVLDVEELVDLVSGHFQSFWDCRRNRQNDTTDLCLLIQSYNSKPERATGKFEAVAFVK
jgi:hypothetical protein